MADINPFGDTNSRETIPKVPILTGSKLPLSEYERIVCEQSSIIGQTSWVEVLSKCLSLKNENDLRVLVKMLNQISREQIPETVDIIELLEKCLKLKGQDLRVVRLYNPEPKSRGISVTYPVKTWNSSAKMYRNLDGELEVDNYYFKDQEFTDGVESDNVLVVVDRDDRLISITSLIQKELEQTRKTELQMTRDKYNAPGSYDKIRGELERKLNAYREDGSILAYSISDLNLDALAGEELSTIEVKFPVSCFTDEELVDQVFDAVFEEYTRNDCCFREGGEFLNTDYRDQLCKFSKGQLYSDFYGKYQLIPYLNTPAFNIAYSILNADEIYKNDLLETLRSGKILNRRPYDFRASGSLFNSNGTDRLLALAELSRSNKSRNNREAVRNSPRYQARVVEINSILLKCKLFEDSFEKQDQIYRTNFPPAKVAQWITTLETSSNLPPDINIPELIELISQPAVLTLEDVKRVQTTVVFLNMQYENFKKRPIPKSPEKKLEIKEIRVSLQMLVFFMEQRLNKTYLALIHINNKLIELGLDPFLNQ
jgi:hypothetical protein